MNLRQYLKYFNQVPYLISDTCNKAKNNIDTVSEQIKECQILRYNLGEYTRKFYNEYKDKLPKELFQKMEKYLNYYSNLVNNALFIMYAANFNKDNKLLDGLDEVSNRADSIGNFAGMRIDDVVKEYEQTQNSNSQTMQPYTQSSYNYGYQSSRSSSNNNTQTTTPTTEPTLNQKLKDVRNSYVNKGDNFGQSIMQTTLEHDLIGINKRLEELQNKQDLSLKEKAELTKLQMDKETYEQYIRDYTNSIRASFRESKLGKTEEKIHNVQAKIDNQKAPARSFLGRRIQKYKLDRLKIRLDKLKEKRGILMDKQQKAVLSRVGRNTNFIKFTNNINAFGETLGTEASNIYNDLREYFSSCKKNNKLLNRLEQLKSKLIVCERTYPCSSYIQARTL